MKVSTIALISVLALPIIAKAQSTESKFAYSGPELPFQTHTFECEKIGDLQGVSGESYQGLDAWGDYLVSLQNGGTATVYKYDGLNLTKVGQLKLGSAAKTNHANVASFTNQFYAKGDRFPLLLVSQAYDGTVNGRKDVCYVERIAPSMKKSTLVATINFKDTNHLCGYALQWVADNQHGWLYAFANTVSNHAAGNKHRIMKFKMPKLVSSGKNSKKAVTITLTERDALENYVLEDTYKGYTSRTGQGLMVKNGRLLMPVGTGTSDDPSILYVWDLTRRQMRNAIDLSKATQGELEDCADMDGRLIVQTQGTLYKIIF